MTPFIDTFYKSVLANEDTAEFLDGQDLSKLKKLQKKH